MKALIIAAGNGTRMQPVTRGRHKSLMPLLGLRIIERVILGAKEAGIYEFVIVTGYKGKELQEFLGNGTKYGVSISFVRNNNWEKANGISALVARKHFRENFALLMSDHVFDPKTLIRIQRLKLKSDECALAIDKNLDSVCDVEDTTKVMVKNGRAIALNKNLENYNAYDTGMFVCSPYIFEVLKKSTSHGKNSLSDGMRILISEDKLRTLDSKDSLWADCDTWEDIKFAQKKLLKNLSKPADGILSKKFNRKVSTFITRFLIKTPITPNMISVFIPVLAILTFFLLSKGTYPWLIFGGLMIQFLSIIDGCDGEIARLKFMKSFFGTWLDPILDRYVDMILIAGMAYGYWNATGNNFIFFLAIMVMFADVLQDYMSSKFFMTTGKKLIASFDFPFKRDVRMLILALGAITGQILASFLIFVITTNIKVVVKVINAKRISDQLKIEN
ncbi:hypothetical protein A2693_03600 [Candidatus Curtissbacteria bacterium RIFCSPHIGHO2_01_FULL_40_12]|uniref:Bifunctional IPC transferase and DIPP synthase n=1 Tax=Candidatus Curtissbacteria bacterium RIFCSPHIGHO2_01_FULL_40_12 TaxID=1797710 RepID=A0A1F5G9R6_9BACT|nr:MAG: hypothetical protein A2693_03600 [Candidatus Curtissbacteria bacterium RIFCSPHIGHO2_01_FULL_40_12]